MNATWKENACKWKEDERTWMYIGMKMKGIWKEHEGKWIQMKGTWKENERNMTGTCHVFEAVVVCGPMDVSTPMADKKYGWDWRFAWFSLLAAVATVAFGQDFNNPLDPTDPQWSDTYRVCHGSPRPSRWDSVPWLTCVLRFQTTCCLQQDPLFCHHSLDL